VSYPVASQEGLKQRPTLNCKHHPALDVFCDDVHQVNSLL
jgi:hypothetical protein